MNITPTGVVLLQELERFNKLLNRMLWTLSQLIRALAGEIGMDSVLDSIASSLFNGQLPDDWRKLAPQTCKQLGGWMEHLLVTVLCCRFCCSTFSFHSSHFLAATQLLPVLCVFYFFPCLNCSASCFVMLPGGTYSTPRLSPLLPGRQSSLFPIVYPTVLFCIALLHVDFD